MSLDDENQFGPVHRAWCSWWGTVAATLLPLWLVVAGWAQDSRVSDPALQIFTGPGAVALYGSERWGTMRLTVRNRQPTSLELFCATYFDGDPTLQYGRRIWLPPESRLETWQPLRVPVIRDARQQTANLRTLILQEGPHGETLVSQQFGELQVEQTLRLAARYPLTAVMEPPPVVGPPPGGALPRPQPVSASEWVLTARYEMDFGQNLLYFVEDLVPPTELALDALDQLVIADDRLLQDPGGLAAIRRWLFAGGRLWVLLDRVDERVLHGLLGDASTCTVVDRTSLEQVTLEVLQGASTSTYETDHDRPVPFVRVIAEQVEVPCRVHGWPAAFWKTCGQGRLLVTTLGGDAWVRPRTPADPLPPGGNTRQTNYVMRPAFEALIAPYFVPRPSLPLPASTAEAHVAAQVGYSIPSWQEIMGTLMMLVISLGGLALALDRRLRLELFAILGPSAAFVASAWLLMAGNRVRGHIPNTTSMLQIVQPLTGTEEYQVTGTLGIFSPNGEAQGQLRGTSGGYVFPQLSGTEGTTKRLVWNDVDAWRWENLPLPPGLRQGTFQQVARASEPVAVTARLDENGVRGRWMLPAGRLPQDAILATSAGRLGVTLHSDGTWTAATTDVLSSGEFLSAKVLSDQQRRRSQIVAKLWENPAFPSQPSLLCWTEPWSLGLEFPAGSNLQGDALIVAPLQWQRPLDGIVVLPPPLLPYREGYGPDGLVPTGFYDARRRQWTEKHMPTATWLQFEPPPELLPLEPQSARVEVRVTGPIGKLSLAGIKQGAVVPIHTWIDPVGTLVWDIHDAAMLQFNAEGKLLLRIAGGDPDRPELTAHQHEGGRHASFWQIESLSLQLQARVVSNP